MECKKKREVLCMLNAFHGTADVNEEALFLRV